MRKLTLSCSSPPALWSKPLQNLAAAVWTRRCVSRTRTPLLVSASGALVSGSQRLSKKSADAFLAGLRGDASQAKAPRGGTTGTVPVAAPSPKKSSSGIASVEELFDDEEHEPSVGPVEEEATASLPPPESIDRETAFYGSPNEDVARAEADGESILLESATALGSVDSRGPDPQPSRADTDGEAEDEAEEGTEEDDLFFSISESIGGELPILSQEGRPAQVHTRDGGANTKPSAPFEGEAARAALEEALEDMALLEEEEEAAALSTRGAASSSVAASSTGQPTGSTSLEKEKATQRDMSFFGASAEELSAAMNSISSRWSMEESAAGAGRASTNRNAGGSRRTNFDAAASAEMESMGEELKTSSR